MFHCDLGVYILDAARIDAATWSPMMPAPTGPKWTVSSYKSRCFSMSACWSSMDIPAARDCPCAITLRSSIRGFVAPLKALVFTAVVLAQINVPPLSRRARTLLRNAAQTGTPFTVSPNISTASGGFARAIMIRDPFGVGGSPDPSNPSTVCATQTRTKANWYNPCAFANPLPGNLIAPDGTTPTGPGGNGYLYAAPVTGTANAIAFLGGRSNTLYGPGYYGVNMSLFKNFITWREQYLQFRTDAFNLLNHPTLGNPSNTSNNTSGGQITGPKFFQNNTPDARFLQLSLKYVF